MTLRPTQEALARVLREHAIREGEFTLNSGRVSRWYLDGRQVSFRGDCLRIVGDAIVDALAAAGLTMSGPKRAPAAPSGPLAGKTFVVTGALEGFTRDTIGEHLAGLGAKVTGSVSASTDYVLAGEGGGSKRAKAESLGVPVIDLAELERLAGA